MGLGPPDEKEFDQRLRLLVVAPSAQHAATNPARLREVLGHEGDVLVCDTVAGMRRALTEHSVDCVVLAFGDAGGDMLPTVDAVLSSVSDEPVVVLAPADEPSLALHAIQAGAQDYLPEPTEDAQALRRAVRHAIARKGTEARLVRQALHDPLTGLPNRALLLDRLNVAIARSRRRPTSLALLFLDLDGFKRVNDRLGHEAGDDLLCEVALRLRRVLRPGDTVARYGGDEFVILCEDLRGGREALRVAERARSAIGEPFATHGEQVTVSASVGIARVRREDPVPQELIREADVAMYRAKRSGGGVELFDPGSVADAISELEFERRLRRAVQHAGLCLHYQPVLALAGDALHSLEALVRWEHPERGLLAPADFLTLADEIGVMAQIDRWVLRQACAQLTRWRRDAAVDERVGISVNLSAGSLHRPDLADAVQRELAGAGLTSRSLSLEVTEVSLERDPARAAAGLADLAQAGVRLCLDDFGTDRSSLNALSSHPFDTVKLLAATTPRMLSAALGAARASGMEAVAEAVETDAQLKAIRDLGCDAAQGFLLARPAPAEQIEHWLASRDV